MKTITVNVTQKNIDEGKHHQCQFCPIAKALQDKGYPLAQVRTYYIDLYGPVTKMDQVLDTTKEIRSFITKFDNSEAVQPFTFELEVPDAAL
jgi:hypothetical protein